MHELSIAMSILEMAQEEADRRGGVKVHAIHLRLGILSGVAKEALLSCYDMACESTVLAGSRLLIEEVPVEILCSACGGPRVVASLGCFACPQCGEPASQIVHGKELEVVALEINE